MPPDLAAAEAPKPTEAPVLVIQVGEKGDRVRSYRAKQQGECKDCTYHWTAYFAPYEVRPCCGKPV